MPASRTDKGLTAALDAGEIVAYFQPVVDATSGRLLGFEALARHEADGTLLGDAADLVSMAEECDRIADLDLAVATHAARNAARWQRERPQLRLAVNVSGRHLDIGGWDLRLHAVLVRAGLLAATVDVELTESERPTGLGRTAGSIVRLQALGYAVWFDDFGTGWAELRDLAALPVDGLKIDRFFAQQLGARSSSVLEGILTMAQRLGVRASIEGVETREQLDRAVRLGLRRAQGYLWSAPPSAATVERVLSGRDLLPGVVIAPPASRS